MTSTARLTRGPMASLAHWAAETFSAPQDALSSGAMHMLEAGTYSMADATPAPAWPTGIHGRALLADARTAARYRNTERREGVDRCAACGCKYWERDRCIDCGGTDALP